MKKYFSLMAAVLFAAVSCNHGKRGIKKTSLVKVDETNDVLKTISSYDDIRNLYMLNDTLLLIIENGEKNFEVYNFNKHTK